MCMCGCTNLYYPHSLIILYGFMGRFQQGRKMKLRLLSFAQNRILFNNSEDLHTTMSIKTHLHIKATRLFSTQEIYNRNLNVRYMYG